MTVAEVERDIMQCSGFVKMMCGVANNCAYYVMMDALDHIRKHPRYADKSIKRLFEGKPNSALDFYKRYRNRLRWPMGDDNRFFHIADLTEEARRKYGAPITDEQYFEFWEATGGGWLTTRADRGSRRCGTSSACRSCSTMCLVPKSRHGDWWGHRYWSWRWRLGSGPCARCMKPCQCCLSRPSTASMRRSTCSRWRRHGTRLVGHWLPKRRTTIWRKLRRKTSPSDSTNCASYGYRPTCPLMPPSPPWKIIRMRFSAPPDRPERAFRN